MAIFLSVLALFVAAGKAFDLLSLKEEKESNYNKVKKWLEKLQGTRFPEVHKMSIATLSRFFSRTFDFKRKPFRSSIILVLSSWILTTSFFIIAIYFHPRSSPGSSVVYWHDWLPWYPTYIINLIFDFLTILISLKIIRWIRDKNFFVACLGLILDLGLAYLLFISCVLLFVVSQDVMIQTNLGTSFVDEERLSYIRFYEGKDTISFDKEFLRQISMPNYVIAEIENNGFSESAKVAIRKVSAINSLMALGRDLLSVNEIITIFTASEYEHNYDAILRLHVWEGEKRIDLKLYSSVTDFNGLSGYGRLFAGMTSLLPTAFVILFLVFAYLSKEVFQISRFFLIRLFKGTLVKEENLEKFSPGTHIGTVLGLLVAIFKLLEEVFF